MADIHFGTMPKVGLWVGKAAYESIQVDDWLNIVKERLKPYTRDITREDCSIIYLAVQKSLIGGQIYAEPSDLAITDGAPLVNNKFY